MTAVRSVVHPFTGCTPPAPSFPSFSSSNNEQPLVDSIFEWTSSGDARDSSGSLISVGDSWQPTDGVFLDLTGQLQVTVPSDTYDLMIAASGTGNLYIWADTSPPSNLATEVIYVEITGAGTFTGPALNLGDFEWAGGSGMTYPTFTSDIDFRVSDVLPNGSGPDMASSGFVADDGGGPPEFFPVLVDIALGWD